MFFAYKTYRLKIQFDAVLEFGSDGNGNQETVSEQIHIAFMQQNQDARVNMIVKIAESMMSRSAFVGCCLFLSMPSKSF